MRYLNALFLFLVIVGMASTGCSSASRSSISSPALTGNSFGETSVLLERDLHPRRRSPRSA